MSVEKKIKEFYSMMQDISENPSASAEKKKEQLESLLIILKDYANFMDGIIKAKMIEIVSDDMDVRYGMESMAKQESDELNTAFGHYTLSENTTGDNNVVVGYSSQYSNQTGNGNVSLGNWNLYFNTAGHHNIAIGYSAAQRLKGSYNIAIGKESLFVADATSSKNIALGIGAGVAFKKGNNNIILGSYGGVANMSDKLHIGNNHDGKTIIEGDMNRQTLKFNVTKLNISKLPTSDAGLDTGDLWNDNGTLKIKN